MMPEQGTEKDPRRTVCLAKAPSLSSLTVPTQLVSAQFVVSLSSEAKTKLTLMAKTKLTLMFKRTATFNRTLKTN